MSLSRRSMVLWLVFVTPWQPVSAVAPPVEKPFEVVIDRPKPPIPTDPVDIAARDDLGQDAIWWGFVGTFELHEGTRATLVSLYYSDSNQNGLGAGSIPNYFVLHAVIKNEAGRWVACKVFSRTRCSFARVLDRKSTSVSLVLQPQWGLPYNPGKTPEEQDGWRKTIMKANTPFTVSLSLSAGCPVISVDARQEP